MEETNASENHKLLANELLKLEEKDKALMRRVMEGMRSDAYIKARNQLTHRIKEIIEKNGFPTLSMVGEQASHASWLLVQHADSDLNLQKMALKLMLKADKNNDINRKNLAYLIDRVRINSGKLQLYGTQYFHNKDGAIIIKRIEEEEKVDKRREDMGLEPLADYIQEANRTQKRTKSKRATSKRRRR